MEWPFIFLAAGASSRMGKPKGLLEYRGGTWLGAQVKALRPQGINRVILVLGRDAGLYSPLLASLPEVEPRLNPDPEGTSFSSLQIGLRGLSGPVWISPLDVPVTARLGLLAEALVGEIEAVVPAHEGRGGHPVLLSEPLIQRLMRLDPSAEEARLDHQIRSARSARVPVDDAKVVMNLNTPETWEVFTQA